MRVERWATLVAVSVFITLTFLLFPVCALPLAVFLVYFLLLVPMTAEAHLTESLLFGLLCGVECALVDPPTGAISIYSLNDWLTILFFLLQAVFLRYLQKGLRGRWPRWLKWESLIFRELATLQSMEAELRSSHLRLQTASRATKVGFFDWDISRRTGYWSRGMSDVLGYVPSRDEVRAREWFRLVHPQDKRWLLAEMQRAARQGHKLSVEFRALPPVGPVRLISARARLVCNAQGRPVRWIGTCSDVTGQRHAEAEFQRRREFLQNFVAHAATRIALFDRHLCFLEVSDLSLQVFGLRREDLLGRNLFEAIPGLPQSWRAAHARCLAGNTVLLEGEVARPDGSKRRGRWEMQPWGDGGAETGGIVIYGQELTGEKPVLREQETAERLLETMTRYAPVSWAFLDTELRYRVLSDRLAQIFGVPAEQPIGCQAEDVTPALAGNLHIALHEILRTNHPVLDQEVGVFFAGKLRKFLLSAYPVGDAHGDLFGMGILLRESAQAAEPSLHFSPAQLHGLLEFSDQAVITLGQSGEVLAFNSVAARTFGCSAALVAGRPLQDFIPDPASILVLLAAPAHLPATAPALVCLTGRHVSGEEFPLEAVISRSQGEGPACWVLVLHARGARRQAA